MGLITMIRSDTARRICVGVAALALVAHAGVAATAAPSRCGVRAGRRPIELCRTTVLKGRSSGYVTIHLSGESKVAADTVAVSGSASFAGFVLVEDRPKFDGTTILGGRASDGAEDHEFVCCRFQAGPGTYRLYLLTGSAPATVTLTLEGQPEGRATVGPSTPASFDLGKTKVSGVGDKASQYYAAGSTGTVAAGHGLSFAGLWVDNAAHLLNQSGRCLYMGEVPSEGFAPGCPWPADRLWDQGGGVAPSTGPTTDGIYGMTWPLAPGTYSHGVYAATAGLSDHALSLTGWLELD